MTRPKNSRELVKLASDGIPAGYSSHGFFRFDRCKCDHAEKAGNFPYWWELALGGKGLNIGLRKLLAIKQARCANVRKQSTNTAMGDCDDRLWCIRTVLVLATRN